MQKFSGDRIKIGVGSLFACRNFSYTVDIVQLNKHKQQKKSTQTKFSEFVISLIFERWINSVYPVMVWLLVYSVFYEEKNMPTDNEIIFI